MAAGAPHCLLPSLCRYFQRSRAAGWGPLEVLAQDYVLCGHFMSANPTSMFALAACCRGSPLSAAVTLSYFQRSRAANWGPLEVLSQDYVLCGHFMSAESDFYEGVRARLIDKDDKPHWKHNSIEEVRGRSHVQSCA